MGAARLRPQRGVAGERSARGRRPPHADAVAQGPRRVHPVRADDLVADGPVAVHRRSCLRPACGARARRHGRRRAVATMGWADSGTRASREGGVRTPRPLPGASARARPSWTRPRGGRRRRRAVQRVLRAGRARARHDRCVAADVDSVAALADADLLVHERLGGSAEVRLAHRCERRARRSPWAAPLRHLAATLQRPRARRDAPPLPRRHGASTMTQHSDKGSGGSDTLTLAP